MPKEYRDTIAVITIFIIIWILVFVALYGNIVLVSN